MSDRNLLLLATTTGYQTREFAEAAERLGLPFTMATDRCQVLDNPWGDNAIPVRFQDPAGSVKRILAANRRRGPFQAVVAVGDRPAVLAAYAAQRLGIPYHSPQAVEAARSKFLARERFREAGMRVPAYRRVALDTEAEEAAAEASYPCVLKPLGLSMSRGVIRANNREEFVQAFHRIRMLLADPDIRRMRDEQDRFLQVESYLEGREFAVEGLVTGGKLQVLALFDKPDALEGPFFEETLYVTPSREAGWVQQELLATAETAVRALGLTQGPVHAELRFDGRHGWILEVAARPIGGLCARSLRFQGAASAMTLEEVILRHACGGDVSSVRPASGAAGVMMIPVPEAGTYLGVRRVEEAAAVPGIEEVIITAKQGQKLVPLPEGNSYPGFLIARGTTAVEVEAALREAHAMLRFEIAPALPVFPLAR